MDVANLKPSFYPAISLIKRHNLARCVLGLPGSFLYTQKISPSRHPGGIMLISQKKLSWLFFILKSRGFSQTLSNAWDPQPVFEGGQSHPLEEAFLLLKFHSYSHYSQIIAIDQGSIDWSKNKVNFTLSSLHHKRPQNLQNCIHLPVSCFTHDLRYLNFI